MDLLDRKSTRLNSSHDQISYAVFCLKKKEDTSELQSRSDLVCRLLLEKKMCSEYWPLHFDHIQRYAGRTGTGTYANTHCSLLVLHASHISRADTLHCVVPLGACRRTP